MPDEDYMLKKPYIFKIGSTFPEMAAKYGDFEDWVRLALEPKEVEVSVIDLLDNDTVFPEYNVVGGIVITGSHEMLTNEPPWSERVARWLPGAVERRIPIFGICYGHQLLAHSLGGMVADNPGGLEFGTTEISLTVESVSDPLFGAMENGFRANVTHTQSVIRLPDGATRLASSDRDPNQAFVVEDSAWGVQFHPEFNREITRDYIHLMRRELKSQGDDPDHLIECCEDTPESASILKRFCRIVESRS